jgi:hypothetical protein
MAWGILFATLADDFSSWATIAGTRRRSAGGLAVDSCGCAAAQRSPGQFSAIYQRFWPSGDRQQCDGRANRTPHHTLETLPSSCVRLGVAEKCQQFIETGLNRLAPDLR